MQNAQNEVKELHNSIGTLDTDVFSTKDDFVKICDEITTVSGKVEEIIDNVQKLPHVAGHRNNMENMTLALQVLLSEIEATTVTHATILTRNDAILLSVIS